MNTWIEPVPNETPRDKTRRLIIHGIKCGKSHTRELLFHAGLTWTYAKKSAGPGRTSIAGPGVSEIESMEREGLIRKTSEGWVLV